MKKVLILIFAISTFFALNFNGAFAQEQKEVSLHFFYGEGCPHCAKEEIFLDKLQNEYPDLKINRYEVWYNKENGALLKEVGKKLNVNISGVPFTVVGDKYFIGWYDENVTGAAIESVIIKARKIGCVNIVGNLLKSENGQNSQKKCEDETEYSGIPKSVKVPIFGEIEIKNLSLPLLTVVFGSLDGFNPCGMWTLIFLISLFLGMKNKKRRWILGSAFILTSAVSYFMFMSAWLNLILFFGFVIWIRMGIGSVALIGGGYNLKEFFTKKELVCDVIEPKRKTKIIEKLKAIAKHESFWLALGGVIVLAFTANLFELLCSAGFPAVYTQVLALSNISTFQHYLYLALYVFFYMLDDIIVFVAAMLTMQVVGLTEKYSRFSHLIGGILMIIIGILLIFKYEWLTFG